MKDANNVKLIRVKLSQLLGYVYLYMYHVTSVIIITGLQGNSESNN